MKRRFLAFALFIPLAVVAQKNAKQAEVKVQKTSMTRDDEIALGKQAAAQVERTAEVIKNQQVETWLNQIGQQLAKTPQANAYPYYFKLVNDESINAFALPGGPMYVHTGLIKAADSEGEVAGVLAHEMSHVALRHGAAQVSKQQTWGSIFGAIGAVAGVAFGGDNGECTLWCQAAQLGAGLGGNSVLMRFSRGYEHDADLNGARMMASAGYNPIELANFFEKLEKKLGTASEPKGLALWLSDHPGTGSRVEYVSEDIRFYPKRSYTASTGNFARVKEVVMTLPPPKPQPGAMLQARQNASPRSGLPAGFKDYQANGFAIGVPGQWQAGISQSSGSLYIVPEGGLVKSELIAGAMIDYFPGTNLEAATADFVESLKKGDAKLRAERSTRVDVGGKPAMMTRMTTKTSSQQDPDQTIELYTVVRDAGLWYLVLAAPSTRVSDFEPAFRDIVRTVAFPN